MIRSITVNEYDEHNRLRGMNVPNPTWELFLEVFGTVRARARRFAGLTLTAEDGSSLLVDGSDGLFFVLYERADGFQFQPLPDETQSAVDVTILCGGVDTTLPRNLLLDEPAALRVIRDFWRGSLHVLIGWEML